MTSLGHVTSSGACPNNSPWALFYRLSIGTIPSSGFVFEIISPKVATKIITWWRHQWRHIARINYTWGQYHTGEHCRRRSILHKNHDVTITTSWGHVTSSGAWPSITHVHFPTIHIGAIIINNICKINYQHIARIPVCVGDRWGVLGGGAHGPHPKNRENIFRAIIK